MQERDEHYTAEAWKIKQREDLEKAEKLSGNMVIDNSNNRYMIVCGQNLVELEFRCSNIIEKHNYKPHGDVFMYCGYPHQVLIR